MIAFLRLRCGMSRDQVLRTSLPEYRCLVAEFEHVDGHRELLSGILDIVSSLFGGKKRAKGAPPPPRTRETALVDRFGGVELPPSV